MMHDLGLLLLRAGVGGAVAAHGAQKLFGWFGGGGIGGTADMFGKAGFRPAVRHARAAALTETGGGLLLTAGLATPAAGAAVAGTMTVAGDLNREAGFFAAKGGFEYPLTLGVASAALALTGPGALSLDRVLGGRLSQPWMAPVALAASLGAATALIRRRRAALAQPAPASAPASVEGRATGEVDAATSETPVATT